MSKPIEELINKTMPPDVQARVRKDMEGVLWNLVIYFIMALMGFVIIVLKGGF